MSLTVDIVPLHSSPQVIAALADILVETVANGGSVSFMHPLAPEVANAFWAKSLAAADAGERVVSGAMEDGELVGTVTLHLDCPPNQPHRGESPIGVKGDELSQAVAPSNDGMSPSIGNCSATDVVRRRTLLSSTKASIEPPKSRACNVARQSWSAFTMTAFPARYQPTTESLHRPG